MPEFNENLSQMGKKVVALHLGYLDISHQLSVSMLTKKRKPTTTTESTAKPLP